MTRNAILFVAASLAVLVLWYRLVDHFAPLPPQPQTPAAASSGTSSASASAAIRPVASGASVLGGSALRSSSQGRAVSAAPLAKEKTVRVDTPYYEAVLSDRGARFAAFKLKGVRSMDAGAARGAELNLVTPAQDPRYGALSLEGTDLAQGDWTLLTPAPLSTPEGTVVRFGRRLGALDFTKTFTFHADRRGVDLRVDIRNEGAKALALAGPLSLVWGPDLGGDGGGFGRTVHSGVVQLADRVERDNATKDARSLDFDAPRWVALKNHYFVAAFFPGTEGSSAAGASWDRAELTDLGAEHLDVALQATGLSVAPGGTLSLEARLWAGPQEIGLLKAVGGNFDSVLQFQSLSAFSWLNPLCVWLLYILKWFHAITGNWGVAIILLTLLVRGAMFYPSMKSMVSMRHMQRKQAVLKPRLDTLKKAYKDNPKKLNEETMKLYKEFGVNPLGGCLPMLVQFPIFWALYDTLAAAYELRGAGFCWRWTDMSAGDPTYIFPIAMGISMFLQQKLSPTTAATSEEQQQMQKTMQWMMPIMFGGMAVWMKWPVGLLLYWTASNVVGVVQQLAVNRVIKD